jgi:hypothetical protein
MSSLAKQGATQPTTHNPDVSLDDILTSVLSPEPVAQPGHAPQADQAPPPQRLGRWFSQHRVMTLRRQ